MPAGSPVSAMRLNLVPGAHTASGECHGRVTARGGVATAAARAGPHCRHAPDRRPGAARAAVHGVARRGVRRRVRAGRADGAPPPASPAAGGRPVADLHTVCCRRGLADHRAHRWPRHQRRHLRGRAGPAGPTARTCWYDRAGIGDSHQLADDAPDPSPGSARRTCAASLAARGSTRVRRARVVVRRPGRAGVRRGVPRRISPVWCSRTPRCASSSPIPSWSTTPRWSDEGGARRRPDALSEQVADVSFGDLPVAVLSQDQVRGKFRRAWLGYHDDLARSSTDGVHVVGIGSGHVMHEDVPDLRRRRGRGRLAAAAAAGRGAGPLRRALHRRRRSLPPATRRAAAPPRQTPDGAADGGGAVLQRIGSNGSVPLTSCRPRDARSGPARRRAPWRGRRCCWRPAAGPGRASTGRRSPCRRRSGSPSRSHRGCPGVTV